MTAGNRISGLSHTTIRVAPPTLVTLLAISFLAGLLAMSLLTTIRAAQQSAGIQPLAGFDAVKFRAEEHGAIQPLAGFDAVKFRAEEHGAIQPLAGFDAVKFRAEELGAIQP